MDNVQSCDSYYPYLFFPSFTKQYRLLLGINVLNFENEGDGETEIYEERKRGKELWGAWNGSE
jgi:hypothetical protein